MDWLPVPPTVSGWFLRWDWKGGMGGGGTLGDGGPSLSWTWHVDVLVLNVVDMPLHYLWPVGREG